MPKRVDVDMVVDSRLHALALIISRIFKSTSHTIWLFNIAMENPL